MFLDYHVNKCRKVNAKYLTIREFHYELAQHYYEKAYGKPFNEKTMEGDK